MPTTYDWLFWTVGGLLGAFALWLLHWSLLHDWFRNRGKRRCPKCWYDMSGTPGNLTCSECGYVAKRERNLLRARRRWYWAGTALLVLIISPIVTRSNAMRRDGWVGLMPTSVMIWIVTGSSNEKTLSKGWSTAILDHVLRERVGISQQLPIQPPELWDWQWRHLILHSIRHKEDARALSRHYSNLVLEESLRRGVAQRFGLTDLILSTRFPGSELRWDVSIPEEWPRDVPLPVHATVESSWLRDVQIMIEPVGADPRSVPAWQASSGFGFKYGQPHSEVRALMTIPELDDGEAEMAFAIRVNLAFLDRAGTPVTRPLIATTYKKKIWFGGVLNDFVRPQRDEQLDALLCEGFELRYEWPTTIRVFLSGPLVDLDRAGNVARLRIYCDDDLVFQEAAGLGIPLSSATGPLDERFCATFDVNNSAAIEKILYGTDPVGQWRLHFTIDPAEMLYRGTNMRGTYWPGEIVEPIDWNSLKKYEPIRCSHPKSTD